MNYYINEYSLRGQFQDVDEFIESLREYTLPVLKKIENDGHSVIWKKYDFWNSKICTSITLGNIPKKKNERSSERAILINRLIKLAYQKPHWSDQEDEEYGFIVVDYMFDEEYRINFHEINCFIKAINDEGRIISFLHDSYKSEELKLLIKREGKSSECLLPNIYSTDWWKIEPKIKVWYIDGKFKVEIRAKEFDYHPPHFHVSYNEYSAVFTLKNGRLYIEGDYKLLEKDLNNINKWYEVNKKDLEDAWDNLHPSKSS